MNGFAPRSLQGRLVLLVVSTVVCVWVVAAVATWIDMRGELDELLDSHLAQAAALLVVQQAREIDDDEEHPDAPSLHRYAPKVAFQVWHEGTLVLRSANAPSTPMGPVQAADHTDRGHDHGKDGKHRDRASDLSTFRTMAIDGTTWRVFSTYGAKRDVQVHVGEQVDSRASILWALMHSMLWPVATALPLLALAAWWGIRRGMAPLRRLGAILQGREPRDLSAVTLDDSPSEMNPMLEALNHLFARIAALMEAESRFTADAAHELRTPIAAVRAQAQVALAEADDGRRRHALLGTIEGCDRATRLVEQLLMLSRLDAQETPALAAVDLRPIVERVMADMAPAALARQQTIELDGADRVGVRGNEALLAALVRNLLDNALRYSPVGAQVHVRLDTLPGTPGRAHLRVEDSGPGLSDEDRVRLGERFFRVLGSDASGSGLGWSIAKRILEVHQAEARVEPSSSLGGLAIDICWPPVTTTP